MAMSEQTTQVTIVGGGPVGMALAIELGQRDVEVTVVEKERGLHRIPKGQNLTQRTMEHFRTWGVEEAVRAARIMPPGFPSAGVNAYGNLMSEYAQPWFRRSTVGQFYFERNERLPQYLTEEVLRQRAEAMGNITILYGQEAGEVTVDGKGASVTTQTTIIRSDYLVGCDGSHSVVRDGLGIEEDVSDHGRRMVLLVFRSRQLFEILEERYGEAAFFNVLHPDLEGYWRFLGMVDVGEGWFFHAPVPSDATVETLDHLKLLHDTLGAPFDLEVDYIGFWDLRVAIASTYRSGRGFIAGDAAHSHPPYGGYGINTGFEDVRNLGWKLAAHIDGWAGPGLLDSYTEERRPVFVSTARDFIERFIERDRRFITDHHPDRDPEDFTRAWEERGSAGTGVSDYVPHYQGSPIVVDDGPGTPAAVGMHELTAKPGHHLPPPTGPDAGDLFSRLGRGFTLLTEESRGEDASRFTDAARELGVPLNTVSLTGMAGYGTSTILVRPDHYIAWVDDGSTLDASKILATAVGA